MRPNFSTIFSQKRKRGQYFHICQLIGLLHIQFCKVVAADFLTNIGVEKA